MVLTNNKTRSNLPSALSKKKSPHTVVTFSPDALSVRRFSMPGEPSTPQTSSDRSAIFLQAEDGIRDTSVTGVQTCALPIYQDARGQEYTTFFLPFLQSNDPK